MMDQTATLWVLLSTCLVMFMTPAGLALFYGGLSNRKSILNTIGMSYTAYCVGTVTWFLLAYELAFGFSLGGVIGVPS
ncbi:MAG: ammonia channel protein, partial [Gammaproteobacteria bacterium]